MEILIVMTECAHYVPKMMWVMNSITFLYANILEKREINIFRITFCNKPNTYKAYDLFNSSVLTDLKKIAKFCKII